MLTIDNNTSTPEAPDGNGGTRIERVVVVVGILHEGERGRGGEGEKCFDGDGGRSSGDTRVEIEAAGGVPSLQLDSLCTLSFPFFLLLSFPLAMFPPLLISIQQMLLNSARSLVSTIQPHD